MGIYFYTPSCFDIEIAHVVEILPRGRQIKRLSSLVNDGCWSSGDEAARASGAMALTYFKIYPNKSIISRSRLLLGWRLKLKHYFFPDTSMVSDNAWRRRGVALQWRHNERDDVSIHQRLHGLLNSLFGRRSKKTSKLCVTGLCEWNWPVTGEFPSLWLNFHQWLCPQCSYHKGPVTRKIFPFDDVIMETRSALLVLCEGNRHSTVFLHKGPWFGVWGFLCC